MLLRKYFIYRFIINLIFYTEIIKIIINFIIKNKNKKIKFK